MGFSKYDIATKLWGKNWRMPNRKHWKELISNCNWVWTKNGYKIIGLNGNSIFLPMTGMRWINDVINWNYGYYWTSEIAEEKQISAYFLAFNRKHINKIDDSYNYVYFGRAVRPIWDINK